MMCWNERKGVYTMRTLFYWWMGVWAYGGMEKCTLLGADGIYTPIYRHSKPKVATATAGEESPDVL